MATIETLVEQENRKLKENLNGVEEKLYSLEEKYFLNLQMQLI